MDRKYTYIVTILCLINISGILNGQEFRFNNNFRSYLLSYIESHGQYLNDIPSETDSCIVISDMLTGTKVLNDADFSPYGIYGFEMLYTHPSDTYLFLKCGNECEIIKHNYGEIFIDAENDESYLYYMLLRTQINQVLDFFINHADMDVILLPEYLTVVCNVYQQNHMYLE